MSFLQRHTKCKISYFQHKKAKPPLITKKPLIATTKFNNFVISLIDLFATKSLVRQRIRCLPRINHLIIKAKSEFWFSEFTPVSGLAFSH